ncbi:MFS-type transporter oryC [Exophiala dermatitidis]
MARKYLGGSGSALTVWISLAASTVLVFYGYDQGVFGNVLVGKNFLDQMGNPSAKDQGTMTSVYNLGCFAGAMSTLYTGDKLGRPRTLLLGSSVIAIGAVIQTACWSMGQMMAGRVVAGLGTGMNTATAGVWQSETSKMRSRGKLVIIQMANCITGFCISNWLTLGFSFAPGSVAWRFPLAFQAFFTALVWMMCPFLPDSPRLLIRKGRYEEALEVLAALEGNGATPDSPSVRTQFNIIKDVLDREHANTYSWWQLLTGRGPSGVLRRMILGAWMQAMNQISGINVTSYFQTYIFIHAINLSELIARILAAAGSVDYLIFSFLAYFVIERYGRRRVMICSAAACSTCWTVISIALGLSETGKANDYKMGALATTFFFVFFASFGLGVLGVPWLYPTEINHISFRGKGASLAMATNWIMNYMVAQVTPPGISNLGYRFWIIWAVICASFVPITYFFYPETANRTLEDIDRYFEEHRNIFVHRDKFATQLQRPEVWAQMDQEFARRVDEEKLGPGVGERQIEVHVAGEDDKAAAANNNNGANVEYLEK